MHRARLCPPPSVTPHRIALTQPPPTSYHGTPAVSHPRLRTVFAHSTLHQQEPLRFRWWSTIHRRPHHHPLRHMVQALLWPCLSNAHHHFQSHYTMSPLWWLQNCLHHQHHHHLLPCLIPGLGPPILSTPRSDPWWTCGAQHFPTRRTMMPWRRQTVTLMHTQTHQIHNPMMMTTARWYWRGHVNLSTTLLQVDEGFFT